MASRIAPEPGLVIPYAYLWRREHEAGEESGRKTRPGLVVVVATRKHAGGMRVAIAPITSQDPDLTRSAVELPRRVKAHLGLNAPRSWVICDEYNEFDWPGVDLGVTPDGKVAYGYAPDTLVEQVRAEMRAARTRGALKAVPRSE